MKDGIFRRTLDKGRKTSVKGLSKLGLGRFETLRNLSLSVQGKLKTEFIEIQGHKMFLDPQDSLGLSFSPVYEPGETALISREVKPGMVALDIGANIGYYTLMLARIVGKSGRVYAFEPAPGNYEILKRNVEINNYQDIVALLDAAVSSKDSTMRLYLSKSNHGDHRLYNNGGDFVDVKSITIDSQNIPKVDFIKMDVQGAEGLALEGMKKTLARQKRIKILMEFWPEGLKDAGTFPDAVLETVRDMDFEIFNVDEKTGACKPLKDHKSLARDYGYTNLFLVKDPR